MGNAQLGFKSMHAPDRELKNAMNAGKKGQDSANKRSLWVKIQNRTIARKQVI